MQIHHTVIYFLRKEERGLDGLLPMSETMMYILFSLREERHGYGVMLFVKELTRGRMVLGAGTIYQTLSKLEKHKMIAATKEADRKKFYRITDLGTATLKAEVARVKEICAAMEVIL